MIDKRQYEQLDIPDELDGVVHAAIAEGLAKRRKARLAAVSRRVGSIAAVFLLCTVVALNLSPVFAAAACRLPVVGDLCRVLLFTEYHVEDEIKYIDARIPQIQNTGKTDLEIRVNQEIQKIMHNCLTESEARAREYYDAFVATGGDPEEFVPVGITVDYAVNYVSPEYASFVVSQYESRFSSYNCDLYYNIDLETGRIITLRDWFGPDYRQIVADSIEATIQGWSEEQRSMLWEPVAIADLISENTNFYLDANGQVVVVIEKYAMACGSAGNLEFPIAPPEQ